MGFEMSIFRFESPTYEEILAVRAERQRMVTDFLAFASRSQPGEEDVAGFDENMREQLTSPR